MKPFAAFEDYFVAFPGSLPDGTAENQMNAALAAACEDIRRYCSQTFTLIENDVIVVDGTGTTRLLLPELPVVTVNTVTIDKTLTTELAVTDFRVYTQDGILWRPSGWPRGFANITIDHNHGYTTVPADLVNTACQLAHDTIISAETATNLTSETIGGYSYTKTAGTPLSVHDFSNALDLYKTKRIPVP